MSPRRRPVKYPNGTPVLGGLYADRRPDECGVCGRRLPKRAVRLCSKPCRIEAQRLFKAAWIAARRALERANRALERTP